MIPELLAGPWPLGFDTVWVYAPFVKDVEAHGVAPLLTKTVGEQNAPLMYVLLTLAASFTRAAPFAITKAFAPILYAFLGFSLYYFARLGLHWDQKKSLLLVLVSTLYFVPLRFSWDMYKNTLGLSLFFLGLSHANPSSDNRRMGLLAGFLVLSLLSSELMAALVAGTFGLLFLWARLQQRRWDWLASALSAAGLIVTMFYLHMIVPLALPVSPLAAPPATSGFLYNYVGSNVDVYMYPSIADVYASVLLLAGFLFAPILPLAALGFSRERRLMAVSIVLAIGSFSILVSPFAALPAWHRWLYMLVFPGLIFATIGFLRLSRRARIVAIAALLFLGVAYIGAPGGTSLPYYGTSYTLRYVPPSLMRNTVLLPDCPDVVRAATWIDDQQVPEAVLVANIWFVGWAKLYVDTMTVYGFADPAQVDNGNLTMYDKVYVLDWAVGQGGFQQRLLPDGAVEVFDSGRIAVYEIIR